jgi:hypothetical protein
LKVGGEDTAHGTSPRVGVSTNPRQFEMHPAPIVLGQFKSSTILSLCLSFEYFNIFKPIQSQF